MRLTLILASLSLAALANGCSNPDPCAGGGTPSFATINTCVIKTSCAISSSCHNAGGHMGMLDLETAPYTAIFNTPCVNPTAMAKGWKRVTPGDETTSYFYQKLILPAATGAMVPDFGMDPNMGLGDRMPDTGQTLDQASIAEIEAWIKMGAPNN